MEMQDHSDTSDIPGPYSLGYFPDQVIREPISILCERPGQTQKHNHVEANKYTPCLL
jgi:hypothetical protein